MSTQELAQELGLLRRMRPAGAVAVAAVFAVGRAGTVTCPGAAHLAARATGPSQL